VALETPLRARTGPSVSADFQAVVGDFDGAAFTELADAEALAGKDKPYIVAVWPPDAQVYYQAGWPSHLALAPDVAEASNPLRLADDIDGDRQRGRAPTAVLTLDLKGVNRLSDLELSINGAAPAWIRSGPGGDGVAGVWRRPI